MTDKGHRSELLRNEPAINSWSQFAQDGHRKKPEIEKEHPSENHKHPNRTAASIQHRFGLK
jgi:hypothetical protein